MVRDPCRHGRGRLLHMGQTLMGGAKVIDRAHQEHTLVQRQGVTCQRPATPRQWREVFPERRVQPLNVRRIDHPVPVRPASERLHACRCAIDDAAFGLDYLPPLVALDDLGDQDIMPGTQSWSSALARVHWVAKSLPNSPDIGHQAISTDQQGPTCRTASHPLDQAPDQGQVPLLADLAPQPQTRLDHHGQRHPHDAALFLDADLIGLHLPQVPWLFDQGLLHGLPLAPGACPPIGNCPLIKPKRRHDRLERTPMGEQGHDDDHGLGRGAQPIEDSPFAGAERFVTLMADEPLFLPRMDTDIAPADLASGMAVPVGAECRRGVHDAPPGYAWNYCHEKYAWTPVFFTTSLHHDLVWSYQVYQLAEYLGIPADIRSRPPTTDTYSLCQSQEEFYFSLPYDKMDLCLYGKNHQIAAVEVARAAGLTPEQVELVYRDITAKRKATRYLHLSPLLVESVQEIGLETPIP